MLPRTTGAPLMRYVQRRQNSSFIKRVMDQVKEDLEKSDGYKKARADLGKSSAAGEARDKLRQQALAQEDTLRRWRETLSTKAESTKSRFRQMQEQAQKEKEKMQEKMYSASTSDEGQKAEPNIYIAQAREFSIKGLEHARRATSTVAGVAGSNIGRILDATKAATAVFEVKEGETRHEAWLAQRNRNRLEREEAEARKNEDAKAAATADSATATDATATEKPIIEEDAPVTPNTDASALVIRHETAWDRFGAKLGDMPFLSNMYDNPLFDRMFGETEMAQSVREMKEIDPGFSLAEFSEEIEHVIAPHVVKCFLEGDRTTLQRQCAGPAFAAVDSSMKERAKQKCYLDPNILLGPYEVELKGAKSMDNSAPSFIWTFQTQQVNCLRDQDHNVIEGAVDDIRTVFYAMALTRHPILDENPEEAMNLEYRWQIRELAIVGNQQCW
eukprot:GEMP01015947.1.p1 GENE.GEMP01015947.1~~GEMP01015947.1.p1  ORF type:complete len:444 (+),score=109.12 GEMP01015947.1:90-1421(+)